MATAPPRPDAVLIRRLRDRDRTAWEELYSEYAPRLHGFAYRLAGNEHDAADLVQETFVRALPRLDRLDPDTTQLGPYLFTTLRNLFLKGVERGKRAQPVDEVPEPREQAPIEDDPERSTLLLRQQAEVRVANSRLSPRQRLVLALRELEDKTYAEIGELVGLKENAVAQLVFRARESLRTELRLAQVDPERLPEPCRSYLPLLAAHLDGQLKGRREDEVLSHLEGCETCQAALESMEEASRRYRTILLPLAGCEEVARGADHELELRGYWSTPAARRGAAARRARNAVLVALGVLALGAGGLGTAALLGDEEPAATATPTTAASAGPAALPPPSPRPAPTAAVAGVTVTLGELTGPSTKPVTVPATTVPVGTTTASTTVSLPAPSTAPTTPATTPPAKPKPKVVAPPKPKPKPAPKPSPKTTQPVVTAGPVTTEPPTTTTAPPPDTTAPTVTISAAPPSTTTSTSASFSFSASEAGVSFACALDGAAFAPCASPAAYSGLADGPHTFAVRGTDAAGNTGPAAQHNWTVTQAVVLVIPDLIVASLTKNSVVVKNVGNGTAGASTLTITVVNLTFSIESLAPGQSTTRTWSICRVGRLTASADHTDVVSESNESNNLASYQNNTCP